MHGSSRRYPQLQPTTSPRTHPSKPSVKRTLGDSTSRKAARGSAYSSRGVGTPCTPGAGKGAIKKGPGLQPGHFTPKHVQPERCECLANGTKGASRLKHGANSLLSLRRSARCYRVQKRLKST
eukprot:scaffold121408_cov30-Tisochrysis_lutea.AAC.10